MNARSKYALFFAIFMACLLFIVFQFFPKQETPRHNTAVNRGIIQSESFIVNSVSSGLNTFAKGTVFASGDKGRVNHVQIVATIEIDPNDWGGVAFNIPAKWYISNIVSSYPENITHSNPANYASTWTTADPDSPWKAIIEVGRDRSYKPTGGGVGTVIIDLVPESNTKLKLEKFEFVVEVGSSVKGAVKTMGTDWISVPITFDEK